jgi:hypothetical protein
MQPYCGDSELHGQLLALNWDSFLLVSNCELWNGQSEFHNRSWDAKEHLKWTT